MSRIFPKLRSFSKLLYFSFEVIRNHCENYIFYIYVCARRGADGSYFRHERERPERQLPGFHTCYKQHYL